MRGNSVDEQRIVWRCSGLHWRSKHPVLTSSASYTSQAAEQEADEHGEHRQVIGTGSRIAWWLRGPRRCIGVWSAVGHTPCPAHTSLADISTAQCVPCSRASLLRKITHNTGPVDDHALYLAWFGPNLITVERSAAASAHDLLLQRGAIAHCRLATGPDTQIRQAEHRIYAAGLAADHLSSAIKTDAWWSLPPKAERIRHVTAACRAIANELTWPDGVRPSLSSCAVTDQTASYGLHQPPPDPYAELTGIRDGAQLSGEIRLIVGQQLLIDTACGPLLIDIHRIAGWILTAPTTTETAAIDTTPRTRASRSR
jgi:hypothetical protein